LTAEDSGYYSCKVTNSDGFAIGTTMVSVEAVELPDARRAGVFVWAGAVAAVLVVVFGLCLAVWEYHRRKERRKKVGGNTWQSGQYDAIALFRCNTGRNAR